MGRCIITAGATLLVRIWRTGYDPDDEVGGAVKKTAIAYNSVPARILAIEPNTVFLQQGIDTLRTFKCTLHQNNIRVYEEDEVEVIYPNNHRYFGIRLTVDSVLDSDFLPDDPRNINTLFLSKREKAHAV